MKNHTWYYGPQFPHATHIAQDPGWEEWLAAVTTSPPRIFTIANKYDFWHTEVSPTPEQP